MVREVKDWEDKILIYLEHLGDWVDSLTLQEDLEVQIGEEEVFARALAALVAQGMIESRKEEDTTLYRWIPVH